MLHDTRGRTRTHYVPILSIQYTAVVPNMWAVDLRRSRGLFKGLRKFTHILAQSYSFCQHVAYFVTMFVINKM
jgi:hypothetical protein